MKNYSYIVIATGILLSSSAALFADVPTVTATPVSKSESAKSSVSASTRVLQKEPVITNEAEYADFVRKNERANQSSSVKFTSINASHYSTSSSSGQTKNQ